MLKLQYKYKYNFQTEQYYINYFKNTGMILHSSCKNNRNLNII